MSDNALVADFVYASMVCPKRRVIACLNNRLCVYLKRGVMVDICLKRRGIVGFNSVVMVCLKGKVVVCLDRGVMGCLKGKIVVCLDRAIMVFLIEYRICKYNKSKLMLLAECQSNYEVRVSVYF